MKTDSSSAVATSWSLAVGGLTIAEVHQIAGMVVMATSFVYTLWRWNRDIKNDRQDIPQPEDHDHRTYSDGSWDDIGMVRESNTRRIQCLLDGRLRFDDEQGRREEG